MSEKRSRKLFSRIPKLIALTLAFVMVMSVVPVLTSAASSKTVEVKTKKELLAQLAANTSSTIIFSPAKTLKFTIPQSESSANKKLIVNAPNTTITNKATFKGITLKETKAFTEKGSGNSLTVKAENAKVTVANGSEVKKMTIEGNGAKVTVAKGSDVEKMTVAADKIDIDVLGKAKVGDMVCKQKGAAVSLKVEAESRVRVAFNDKTTLTVTGDKTSHAVISDNAEGCIVKASVPIEVTAGKDLKLVLKKGSEGSTVNSVDGAKVSISGEAKDKATVKEDGQIIKEPEKTENNKEEESKDTSPSNDTPVPYYPTIPVVDTPVPVEESGQSGETSPFVEVNFPESGLIG